VAEIEAVGGRAVAIRRPSPTPRRSTDGQSARRDAGMRLIKAALDVDDTPEFKAS
jgi:hypothetical protein